MAPSGEASLAPKRARQVKGAEFDMHMATLVHWWMTTPTTELVWIFIGLGAQLLFSMRFIVQWIATEKARASIIPENFWYFSFFGGILLLAYACYREDPVFILGQAAGLIIYSRNIYFIWLGKKVPSPAKAA